MVLHRVSPWPISSWMGKPNVYQPSSSCNPMLAIFLYTHEPTLPVFHERTSPLSALLNRVSSRSWQQPRVAIQTGRITDLPTRISRTQGNRWGLACMMNTMSTKASRLVQTCLRKDIKSNWAESLGLPRSIFRQKIMLVILRRSVDITASYMTMHGVPQMLRKRK